MKKHIAIAAGVLFALGTVSATSSSEAPVMKPAASIASAQMGSKESTQILAIWQNHASSAGSIPLARPL
jgi:hypothetical protein